MQVHQILKAKASEGVVTVTSRAKLSEAAKILAEKRIGTVVISDDGGRTASGILSERDIVRALARSGGACLTDAVTEHMTRDLVTCARQDTADSVLQRMTDGRFRHMPVIEDGVMVGLITQGDVVKSRLDELTMEKTALEGMIMGH